MDKDSLRLFLEQGLSLEEIGRRVDRHPSTVGYWVKKHGLTAVNRTKHEARGGISRDRLTELVSEGLSFADMARLLGLSATTVRYWAKRYDLETRRTERVRVGKESRADGLAIVEMHCHQHVVRRSGSKDAAHTGACVAASKPLPAGAGRCETRSSRRRADVAPSVHTTAVRPRSISTTSIRPPSDSRSGAAERRPSVVCGRRPRSASFSAATVTPKSSQG